VQLAFMSSRGQWYGSYWFNVLTVHTLALAFIYSVAFLLGCLVRDAARAAILSFGVVLLVYFLPVVVRPLGWLSVLNLMELRPAFAPPGSRSAGLIAYVLRMLGIGPRGGFHVLRPEHLTFDAVALAGSAAAFGLAWWGVKRDWRLRTDARAMCWTLGAVALLLFGATASQIGSNLHVERVVPVFPGRSLVGGSTIARIFPAGHRGILLVSHFAGDTEEFGVRPFDLSKADGADASEVRIEQHTGYSHWAVGGAQAAWDPQHPNVLHLLLTEQKVEDNRTRRLTKLVLLTATLAMPQGNAETHELDLLPHVTDDSASRLWMHCVGDTLYVIAFRDLIAIDVGDPGHPTVSEVIPIERWGFSALGDARFGSSAEAPRFRMLPVPDLDPEACFALSVRLAPSPGPVALEGDLLVVRTRTGLTTYRLDGIEGNTARLREVGRLPLTPLERLTAEFATRLVLKDGLAYALVSSDKRVQVYDVRQPEQPRRLGFYVAPGEFFSSIVPLDDGRVLVGGHNLHVLAPPRLD
jgi:hypothetical protein